MYLRYQRLKAYTRSMDYTLLRSFHAVASEGSFVAAARVLNLSQSTLSTQVKGLEARYGVELFYRKGRGVILTEVGRSLLIRTQRMFVNEQEIYEYLRAVHGLKDGHLKISAVGPYYRASEIFALYNERYPHVEISVQFGNSQHVRDDILNCRTEVGLLGSFESHPQLFSIQCARPNVVVVVKKGHRLSGHRTIRIEELEGEKVIRRETGSETRRTFEEAIEHMGVSVQTVMEIGSREAMLATIAQGTGIGVASDEEFIGHPSLEKIQISNVDIRMSVHVVCLAERKEGPIIQSFLEVVDEIVARSGGA